MLHPIFSTVLGHPELIAEHVANYAALVRQETAQAGRGLVARLVAGVLAAASAMLALGLIGVAVLLGVLHGSFHWVLVIVPGVAVLIAAFCAWYAMHPNPGYGFDDLRTQLDADLQALHNAGAHHGQR
ncbi:phage holin family protein [Variovorax sp. PAMC26660]|uniref:phage holin family protein n=1 Tax=Variovorax sp. PAMC26660 TaxID=2762322 RepID=UPI00164E3BD1|nr:phage holin family protein [Variovorax sp. PAMC26660]QNK69046.1 phage holin family protein [Variovorax sp. PAMC26660]